MPPVVDRSARDVAPKATWPAHGLTDVEVVLADDDELVVAGFDAADQRVVVSMRDLGEDVSAGFWDDELRRLGEVVHPAAARIIGARIVGDRYFVVTVVEPPGMFLKTRLLSGPLGTNEAGTLLIAALEVMATLHGVGVSAAGTRLRTARLDTESDGRPLFVVTTYGLHVDNDIEIFNELRELALRVLALVGGRYDRSSGLVLPVQALSPELEAVLRQAVGLGGPPFAGPLDMATAVLQAMGQARPRGAPRSQVRTRPMASGPPTIYGSDLLLAEEFLATLPRDSQ